MTENYMPVVTRGKEWEVFLLKATLRSMRVALDALADAGVPADALIDVGRAISDGDSATVRARFREQICNEGSCQELANRLEEGFAFCAAHSMENLKEWAAWKPQVR